MNDESLPKLTKAPIPVQTHTLSFEERLAKGKAYRDTTGRKSQSEWKPPAHRKDPIDLLIESSKGRIEELLPIRYGRMMVSPFTFYRGAAAIMAYDLSHTPSSGLTLVADGDCHLLNFGGFATAERNIIFDINVQKDDCQIIDKEFSDFLAEKVKSYIKTVILPLNKKYRNKGASSARPSGRKLPVQVSRLLFMSEHRLVEKLRKADPTKMNLLQAITLLKELKDMSLHIISQAEEGKKKALNG
jgi:hypothetical protein